MMHVADVKLWKYPKNLRENHFNHRYAKNIDMNCELFLKNILVSLTPDGQVVYVHLVPVVILYCIDKGIPLGFVQVDFTVACLHDFVCRDHKCHSVCYNTRTWRVDKKRQRDFATSVMSAALVRSRCPTSECRSNSRIPLNFMSKPLNSSSTPCRASPSVSW